MNNLPAPLVEALSAALRALGDSTPLESVRSLGGGCINNAQRVQTGRCVYFLKWNPAPIPGMFTCEARGLELLAKTKTVRVPAVLAEAETDTESGCPAYMLLEWLEGPRGGDMARLGEQLAELHRHDGSDQYGLDHDNYIGSGVQRNAWEPDWARFFAQYRLQPQYEMALRGGNLPSGRRQRLERLISRLPDLLGGIQRRPSLIHGDLWGGNVTPSPDGLALIDPAVSYSDREAEIAFTKMFGGFTSRFYAGYQSAWPLDPTYPARRDIYNIYHLLNHLNLFGEGYGEGVDAVLDRY